MTKWDHTLKLADVFHNDALSFEQRRDKIVRRIRAAKFYDPESYALPDLVEELSETTDADDFDQAWDAFYDWADVHRVWVSTV